MRAFRSRPTIRYETVALRKPTGTSPEPAAASARGGRGAQEATLHATCVAIHGRGVVLTGGSGAGKSALGLQLIDGGAMLVSDDVTVLCREGPRLIARAPDRGAGLIEAHGNGIMRLAFIDQAPVAFFVEVGAFAGERLPEPAYRTELDVSVPVLRADPGNPASAALIRLAVVHGPPHIPDGV